jgi:hypothetical protein
MLKNSGYSSKKEVKTIMTRSKKRLLLLLIPLVLTACASPGIKGKYVSLNNDTSYKKIQAASVEGRSCMWWVLLIPIGKNLPVEAYDDAISQSPPATTGLADAKLYLTMPMIGGALLSRNCTHVTGIPAHR